MLQAFCPVRLALGHKRHMSCFRQLHGTAGAMQGLRCVATLSLVLPSAKKCTPSMRPFWHTMLCTWRCAHTHATAQKPENSLCIQHGRMPPHAGPPTDAQTSAKRKDNFCKADRCQTAQPRVLHAVNKDVSGCTPIERQPHIRSLRCHCKDNAASPPALSSRPAGPS